MKTTIEVCGECGFGEVAQFGQYDPISICVECRAVEGPTVEVNIKDLER